MAALDEVRWDLAPLLDGAGPSAEDDAASVNALLDEADGLAEAFAAEHEGKVAELDGPGLKAAMERLAEISDLAGRAGSFAMLRFSADTQDPAVGALMDFDARLRVSFTGALPRDIWRPLPPTMAPPGPWPPTAPPTSASLSSASR